MPATRWVPPAERAGLGLLCLWLLWLPLPFGSNIPRARLPLILVPLLLCAIAAAIRLYATRDRTNAVQPTRPWLIWGNGALLFLAVTALQLVPLPPAMLTILSPESLAIWNGASQLASLAGVPARGAFPLTVDPHATASEWFRMVALFATFITAALLVRTHSRRLVLAFALCGSALFQALYGMREAALQRYEIWGWVNRLIFNRVTGTFVNPNHFAHYVSILLPMALFVGAVAWHRSGPRDLPFGQRFANLLERELLRAAFAALTVLACAASVLVAASRGGLLAMSAGVAGVAAMLPGRRVVRLALSAAAMAIVIAALIVFLGPQRTVGRFVPNEFERETFVGRRIGIEAALGVWQRFSLFGSGLGTFERMVSSEQRLDVQKIYHHAHNDYAELAATTGTIGFTIAVVALLGGYAALVYMTFGRHAAELTWRRRAFQTAALASLTIAMVHALFDFNFFIPSNPATLAAICGAAVASLDHDKRARR